MTLRRARCGKPTIERGKPVNSEKQVCKIAVCDYFGCEVFVVPCPNTVPTLGAVALGMTVVFVVLVAWIVKRGRE